MEHAREISLNGEVSLNVQVAKMDPILDVALIDDTAEKIAPVYFSQALNPICFGLAVKNDAVLRLFDQPLMETVDDTLDGRST